MLQSTFSSHSQVIGWLDLILHSVEMAPQPDAKPMDCFAMIKCVCQCFCLLNDSQHVLRPDADLLDSRSGPCPDSNGFRA